LKFQEILELIDKVAEQGIHSVEIEQSGTKVKIEGKSSQPQVIQYHGDAKPSESSVSPSASSSASSSTKSEEKPKTDSEPEAGLHIITSPIVGTFYRSPSPESPSFVNPGDKTSKGKVLCIIEAMKLMNEIESDVDGVIVEVYPANGQPVEYGEKLFAVRV
jgi:acetyl-CoA carboxylase biotin carboxyl carrier protein